MKKKIINCLCNECAGPNLEQMVGVGVGIAVAVAFYSLARQAVRFQMNIEITYSRIQITTLLTLSIKGINIINPESQIFKNLPALSIIYITKSSMSRSMLGGGQ